MLRHICVHNSVFTTHITLYYTVSFISHTNWVITFIFWWDIEVDLFLITRNRNFIVTELKLKALQLQVFNFLWNCAVGDISNTESIFHKSGGKNRVMHETIIIALKQNQLSLVWINFLEKKGHIIHNTVRELICLLTYPFVCAFSPSPKSKLLFWQ